MSQTAARGGVRAPGRVDLAAQLRAHADAIRAQGIVSLAILGSRARGVTYPREPAGTPFTEDEAHLRARYPKLWRRFGARPLQ